MNHLQKYYNVLGKKKVATENGKIVNLYARDPNSNLLSIRGLRDKSYESYKYPAASHRKDYTGKLKLNDLLDNNSPRNESSLIADMKRNQSNRSLLSIKQTNANKGGIINANLGISGN